MSVELALEEHVPQAVLIIDGDEQLTAGSAESFNALLGIEPADNVKVVSIFGKTGVGKSYLLNHVFFEGREVFRTSAAAVDACTKGVWMAYDRRRKVIVVDTEGQSALDRFQSEGVLTRLLLKVLAVSDVIIIKIDSQRFQQDAIYFLKDSGEAYQKMFAEKIRQTMKKMKLQGSTSSLGPCVILLQETAHEPDVRSVLIYFFNPGFSRSRAARSGCNKYFKERVSFFLFRDQTLFFSHPSS